MATAVHDSTTGWRPKVNELLNATGGGLLFGITLLFTLEVWTVVAVLPSWWAPVILLVTVAIATVLDRTAGFRFHESRTWRGSIVDGFESVAVGLVCTVAVLGLLGELDLSRASGELFAKIVAESMPFSIGAALANELLGRAGGVPGDEGERGEGGERGDGGEGGDGGGAERVRHPLTFHVGLAAIGSVIIALAIAPTDEVLILATHSSSVRLVLFPVLALIATHIIVFEASLRDTGDRRGDHPLQHPLVETSTAYVVAIGTSAVMLLAFGQIAFDDPAHVSISRVLVLSLPAAIGGAAGRLAL